MLLHVCTPQGTDKVPLPDQKVLQQIAAYTKHPVLPVSGSILAAMAAAAPATAGSSGSSAAIVSLPGHANIEHSALAKSCCCCNKHEGQDKVSSSWPTWLVEITAFCW